MLPPLDNYNRWADFWRYNIGVNVIPAYFVPYQKNEHGEQTYYDDSLNRGGNR
jgi:hypothetical protein